MKAPFLFWSEETGLTCPTPGVLCMPLRCTPAHSSAPGTVTQHKQQGRPCQMQGRPCKARHTRQDAGHAAQVCTQYQTDRAGQIVTAADAGMYDACMLRVQRSYMLVRLILNILLTCTFNHV